LGERPDLTPREAIPIFSNFSSVSFNSLLPLISLVLNAAACFLNSGPSDSIHEATAASFQSFTEEKKKKKEKKKEKSNHITKVKGPNAHLYVPVPVPVPVAAGGGADGPPEWRLKHTN